MVTNSIANQNEQADYEIIYEFPAELKTDGG